MAMNNRFFPRVAGLVAVLASWWLGAAEAGAHPMGNFAICHYARIRADCDAIRVRFVLDLAEVPTVGEKRLLDRDGDGRVSPEEEEAYLKAKAAEILPALALTVDGTRLSLRQGGARAQLAPGAGGLETLKISFDLSAPWPAGGPGGSVNYRDGTYPTRSGWKEVVAVAGPGAALEGSSVPAADRSAELSDYPPDVIPPQVTEAHFTAKPGDAGGELPEPAAAASARTTPRDAFTQAIAAEDLGAAVVLTGLLLAFVFGALHALSPGHGKAMVAAYLVGARSTSAHAVLLGAVVTVTHTLGVFALGLFTLLASANVLPEVLYPALGAASGLAVCGLGLWLLYRRVRRLLRGPRPPQASAHGHGHSHLPDGPITVRALIALGVSGGIIPCPSALVVLLAAVALHRIGYGLLLITSFSLGLAAVLVVIGLLVVRARRWLEGVRVSGALLRRIPVASAAVITLIGAALVVRALGQGMGW
jgi:ABC-type nickel/cobalt efflux system permease component RcnA